MLQLEIKSLNCPNKPIVSYYNCGDVDSLKSTSLTDINVILTKTLSDAFIEFLIQEKHRVFLHFNISGMGKTIFEPNIQSVKESFIQLKKLINLGFNIKQILVIVSPIIQNDNGLKAIKLLLKLFSEFSFLRLRYIRFNLLLYRYDTSLNKNVILNPNILKRTINKKEDIFLQHTAGFIKQYYDLIKEYKSIVHIDSGEEPLIGVRELLPFGYRNEFKHDNKVEKIITYIKNNRFKPDVKLISNNKQCKHNCLLCSFKK